MSECWIRTAKLAGIWLSIDHSRTMPQLIAAWPKEMSVPKPSLRSIVINELWETLWFFWYPPSYFQSRTRVKAGSNPGHFAANSGAAFSTRYLSILEKYTQRPFLCCGLWLSTDFAPRPTSRLLETHKPSTLTFPSTNSLEQPLNTSGTMLRLRGKWFKRPMCI